MSDTTSNSAFEREAYEAFEAFVEDPSFSCLAGKGVLHGGACVLRTYGALGAEASSRALARDLTAYVNGLRADETSLTAFVAIFGGDIPQGELAFERDLWAQLQGLHERDSRGDAWAPGTSTDPEDPSFAFNFGGEAMFVVGIHPQSSRLARRFRWPALVFNPHRQFERLRQMNKFERLRSVVRDREVALQGSLNPNLADFGERSEARQYSGRRVEEEWRCPFHHGK